MTCPCVAIVREGSVIVEGKRRSVSSHPRASPAWRKRRSRPGLVRRGVFTRRWRILFTPPATPVLLWKLAHTEAFIVDALANQIAEKYQFTLAGVHRLDLLEGGVGERGGACLRRDHARR